MLVRLLLLCNTIALAKLVERPDHQGYHDGSVHSSEPQIYETSAYPQRTPLSHQGGYWQAEGLKEDTQDYPSSVISSHQEERGDFEGASTQSRNGNWCSFMQSRLVTYIEACMKEKYIVNSQQPCPNGTPDCQKIMYRTALKPVYQVKQKVLKSLQWKCCPGYIGKDCEERDPNFILVPGTETQGREEEFSNHMSTSVDSRELLEVIQNHEALLDDLQSDIHQAVSNLGDLQRLSESNGTSMVLEVNQSNADLQERLLQRVLFPHVENFLREHFKPVWASFNRSLQNLSNIVRNLSHDVAANKKSIERFQESAVPKKEFQELGTKFESKVQENIVRADQVKRDIENQLHMQQASIHYNLSMLKADTDTKLKKLHKTQQSHFLALNNSIANMKQEQNNLENKLETLEKNLTELFSHNGPKDENSQLTIRQINDILSGHAKQLKELYMESDVAFQNIAVLEKWFKELKKNISKYRPEDLTITLTEKSIIMEENNAAMERQISELNYTLSNLQENYSELLRYMEECNCQRISSDTDILEEDAKNITYSLEDTQSNLKDMKHLESVFRDLLRNEIEELSSAISSIHLSLNLRQEENRQLQSQVTAFSEDIGLMKKKDEEIHRHIKYLNSSFGSLLEDAMRHEVALEALLKEEFMDVLFEDDFSVLIPSVFQLQESLRHISDKLQEQNVTLESLIRSLPLSERGQQNNHDAHTSSEHPKEETQTSSTLEVSSQRSIIEHMEPNYEAAKDDSLESSAYNDIMTLKNDIKHLSLAIKSHESRSDTNLCCNQTIANVIEPLNSSVGILSAELATLKRHLHEHLRIFKKLFGSNEELVASKISLDVTKIQSMLNRKDRRQQKGQDKQRDKKRPEKHRENTQISGRNTVQTELMEKDSLVAFHVGFSEGKDKEKTVRFNETYFNYGNSYFPEHGHFKAPHKGVYLFVISVEFSSGPALGQLSFSRGYKRTLSSSQRKTPNGNTMTTFAMAEMEKGETVSFELLQGSVVKRSPPGTTLGGFLISKT
ncbi:multimerin-2 isoform X1 [Pithys albifrons albifrons]|uniref:multimerin-2 isoform X1 n=1 Tax=Pithys albifrons albifrons TaxID=3385563 RepID=UPI003A5D1A42